MCGIVGFNWEDQGLIKRLADLLKHRGPEQEGFHIGNGVSLGHRRLRIIDLSERARQPMYNEDGLVCTVYNGEIFNFKDLRTELQRSGHQFRSQSDTEVLVHGYEQWGMGLLNRVRGQFAFCILDARDQCLILARDHLGIKPLYFWHRAAGFMFGSELKVFLEADVPKAICQDALDYYVLLGNTPPDQSMLQAVRKVPPAGYLIYDLRAGKIAEQGRYWRIRYEPDPAIGQEEAIRLVRQYLSRSVHSQLVSDVPLGAFLSGGLDSSAVVALMRPHVRELNTFSIRFDRPGYDESYYARIVSRQFNTIHHQIQFDASTVRELIEQLPYYYDEPFADPSMIPTCLVSRVARGHVTVALSGTGADELFGGYPRYVQIRLLRLANSMPCLIKGMMDHAVAAVNVIAHSDLLSKFRTFLGPREPPHRTYLRLLSYMSRTREEGQIGLDRFDGLAECFRNQDLVTNALCLDMENYLPECLLTKEDRASMAVSLEARVPILDLELVELAARLPRILKIRGLQRKYVLKKAMEGILPRPIIYRRKQGFGVPLAEYLRAELMDLARGIVFADDVPQVFDRTFVAWAWDRHQAGAADYSRLIWTVMMFNLWFKRWCS